MVRRIAGTHELGNRRKASSKSLSHSQCLDGAKRDLGIARFGGTGWSAGS